MIRRVFEPVSVHVRIASGCNLGCVFCERENIPEARPGSGGRRKTLQFTDGRPPLSVEKDMTDETWDLVAAKFMPHTDRMELGGLGEPTLGKLFPRAAKEIVAAGKQLFFFTNGHFLNKPHVLEAVGDTPHVSISIDAGSPEAYRAIRKGDLSRLIESVQAFRAAKPGAKIDSQFTAIASNIDEIPKWVHLCAMLGIGRRENGEQLLLIGADHHSTDRVNESVRFHRDRTLSAVSEASIIAQKHGIWFMSQLPEFSTLNPNAGVDGSDPRGLRRWGDLIFFGANPCGGTNPGDGTGLETGTVGITSVDPDEPPIEFLPQASRFSDQTPEETVKVGKEVYVDYDGEVWSCLSRNKIGNVAAGDWKSIIRNNLEYQEFLANWHFGTSNNNSICRSCPRRK
jgi:radical SAM protein with 4Fe4S-binding SPASM domain